MQANRTMAAVTLAVMGIGGAAQAATVWADDFTGETNGAAPTQNYAVATGNDWTVAGVTESPVANFQISTAIGAGSPSLAANDASGSNNTIATVQMNRFAAFDQANAAHARVTASFDFRVDSFSAGNPVSNFRFIIRDSATTTNVMTVGFAYGDAGDGDASTSDLFLFAAPNNAAPTPAEAIAIGRATTGWQSSFDFGDYNSTTAANNDTNDAFYRIALTFTAGSTTVVGSATPIDANGIATDPAATFERTVTTAFSLASDNVFDRFDLQQPGGGQVTAYVDNISFDASAVPEPTALALLAAPATMLLCRGRRG